ncbi:hypothetical protein BKA69DRAFT_1121195 [Paraphysoderma sedebokerense]|nr:hypothetical protein BKA69DRAFT_1121195 [Paraphysoderma sedebokerense]
MEEEFTTVDRGIQVAASGGWSELGPPKNENPMIDPETLPSRKEEQEDTDPKGIIAMLQKSPNFVIEEDLGPTIDETGNPYQSKKEEEEELERMRVAESIYGQNGRQIEPENVGKGQGSDGIRTAQRKGETKWNIDIDLDEIRGKNASDDVWERRVGDPE